MAAFGTGSYTTASQIASTWVSTTCTSTSTGASTVYVYPTGGNSASTYVQADPQVYHVPVPVKDLVPGKQYDLPDGSILKLDMVGNYTIEDKNAKVTYRANRIREFNPYLNASDLLEDFIRDMKLEGVKQWELLNLPVNIFIHWLILQAALKDGDTIEDVTPPVQLLPKKKDRCLCCGRFLPRVQLTANVMFCDGSHLDKYRLRSGQVGQGQFRPVTVR